MVPYLRRKASSLLPLTIMLVVRFLYMPHFRLRKFPSFPNLLSIFITKKYKEI